MLLDIISELATDFGIRITDDNERAYLIDKVNKAAEEVYDSNLLRGCEMEQVIEIDPDRQQISLPPYMGRCLNIKHHYSRMPINQESLRPHYLKQEWAPPYLNWRIKKYDYPFAVTSYNVGPITFTLPNPATEAFVITVCGPTTTSQHKVEEVVFAIGDTTKTTTSSFFPEDVKYIKKSAPTEDNIEMTDLEGTWVGTIYNNEPKAHYTIVNVLDWVYTPNSVQNKFVEVLFKPTFVPMVEDTDVFCAGETYERAVYYKTSRYLLEKQEGKLEDAIAAEQACTAYLNAKANEVKRDEAATLVFKMPLINKIKLWPNWYAYRASGINNRTT